MHLQQSYKKVWNVKFKLKPEHCSSVDGGIVLKRLFGGTR